MKRILIAVVVTLALLARSVEAVPWASLQFGAAATDVVAIGNAASISNLGQSAFSVVTWAYVTTITSVRTFVSAPANAGAVSTWRFSLQGTTGDVQLALFQSSGVSAGSYITNDTPVAASTWVFLAATYDSTLGSNRGNIYRGTVSGLPTLRTLGTNTQAGTVGTETGANSTWGNRANTNVAIQGALAIGQIYNRVLTLGELQQLWLNPRPLRGCVNYLIFGANGTGRVNDRCARNDGTITGAIPVNNFVPVLARALRLRVAS